jgi:VanZ family protein
MTTSKDGQFPTAPAPASPGDRSVDPASAGQPADRTPPIRRTIRRWGPVLAWMALIFLLSAQPGLRISDDPAVDSPIRHFAHVLAFAALAILLLRGLSWGAPRPWTWRAVAAAVALATLYGVTDEVHQTYVPLRTGHLIDVGWDLLGATTGLAVLWLVARRWPRLASVVAGQD